MEDISYGFGRDLDGDIASVIERVQAALKAEGFGVLTRIDVHEVMQKKLGLSLPPYVILGACNPQIASQAIALEPQIGLLLPCNVVIQQRGPRVSVSMADPAAMGTMTQNPALAPLMAEADARLHRALAAL